MVLRIAKLIFIAAVLMLNCESLAAQQGPTSPPRQGQTTTPPPVVAPQVNPVVHRLSGLKMLNYLRRSGVKVAPLSDEAFKSDNIQTSIAAGLSLDDGTIVARLPRADLEIFEMSRLAPSVSTAETYPSQSTSKMLVVQRDGRELTLKFMGFDGGTGLSLLQGETPGPTSQTRDSKEESLTLGQRVRLLSPERAPLASGVTSSELYVSIGELVGKLTRISRTPSGQISRITVTADGLSPSILGGIAVNDAGETIGVIEANNGNEAELIPIAGVRRAVERIRVGFESKPRPWLGARGMSLAVATRAQLESNGWNRVDATRLMSRQIGIVLTSVPPQTPAWLAKLRAGDVVVRMNGAEVGSAEEFSTLLTRAGGKARVSLTVMKPGRAVAQVVSVQLNVSLNPVLEMEVAEERAARIASSDPLFARGIESLSMTSELASRLNAQGGRVVVFVHPSSAASHAGLVAGDVIESVNDVILTEDNVPTSLPNKATITVVRDGQRLAFQIEPEMTPLPRTKL